MIPNYAIRNLIRENKVHQIYGIMQTGQGASGMQTMNQALQALPCRPRRSREAMARSLEARRQTMIEQNVTIQSGERRGR
ncbi:MAG: hypothetical protein R3B99_35745 [Polyangiales bacterium]